MQGFSCPSPAAPLPASARSQFSVPMPLLDLRCPPSHCSYETMQVRARSAASLVPLGPGARSAGGTCLLVRGVPSRCNAVAAARLLACLPGALPDLAGPLSNHHLVGAMGSGSEPPDPHPSKLFHANAPQQLLAIV